MDSIRVDSIRVDSIRAHAQRPDLLIMINHYDAITMIILSISPWYGADVPQGRITD